MTDANPSPTAHPDNRREGRTALLVFLVIMVIGSAVIAITNKIADLGSTPTTALLVLLPILAAAAASTRLRGG